MRLVYWLGEGSWVCCLCVCWSRGLIWNQYSQWFMVGVHCGAGLSAGKSWIFGNIVRLRPCRLSFFFFFFLFAPHASSESQLVSSCVALITPAGHDIYIKHWGWQVESSGIRSWSRGSASLQLRSKPLETDRHRLLHTVPVLCFRQQSSCAGFDLRFIWLGLFLEDDFSIYASASWQRCDYDSDFCVEVLH